MRVSFPVRQMLRLLSDSISRNVERLSYAQRLRTRKLVCAGDVPSHSGGSSLPQISTLPMDQHPTGYIVSNAEDLLSLFDADCGVLVIGEGAKIMGPNDYGQDILLVAEYLRVKQFTYAISLERRFLLSRSCHSKVCSKSLNASRRTIQTSDYHPAWTLFRASSTSHYRSLDRTSLRCSEKASSAEYTGLVDLTKIQMIRPAHLNHANHSR
jgi:hypothetical protein